MRMWMVSPDELCDQHLLGEHHELHTVPGMIEANPNAIRSLCSNGMLDLSCLESRHWLLAKEMQRRGMNHDSPLFFTNPLDTSGTVDPIQSRADLRDRCASCADRLKF